MRYWEESGLIAPGKNRENNYREYSVSDLMTISDIMFYKNLGLPLKQIRRMDETDTTDQRQLLEGKMEALEQQKKAIDRQIQQLNYHISAIQTIEELETHPLSVAEIDT